MSSSKRILLGVVLFCALAIIAWSIFLLNDAYTKKDRVQADAVITGFYYYRNLRNEDQTFPVIGFLVKDDCVHVKMRYYSGGMKVGDHYAIEYAARHPKRPIFQESRWTGPLFLFAFAVIFLIMPVAWTVWSDRRQFSNKG